ncbi:hypothetical protein ATKI12_3820 [Kitasatospora sp. Ki12]
MRDALWDASPSRPASGSAPYDPERRGRAPSYPGGARPAPSDPPEEKRT